MKPMRCHVVKHRKTNSKILQCWTTGGVSPVRFGVSCALGFNSRDVSAEKG